MYHIYFSYDNFTNRIQIIYSVQCRFSRHFKKRSHIPKFWVLVNYITSFGLKCNLCVFQPNHKS